MLDHELTIKLQGNLLCVSYDSGYQFNMWENIQFSHSILRPKPAKSTSPHRIGFRGLVLGPCISGRS